MMNILRIFIVLMTALTCYGQTPNWPVNIKQSEVCYRNFFSNGGMTHLNYLTLENQTSEAFYFWIGRVDSEGVDPERLFFAYFYGKKAAGYNVSFGDVVTDGTNILSGYGIKEIGYNFIKLLKPGDKFTIIMPSEKASAEFFIERFVFMTKSDVEQKLGTQIESFVYLPSILDLQTAMPPKSK